ncbi:hypothetical protein [Ruegeria sp.]|uniref:hypothetical protein n=1 Tax=Ruegeria sp. TaxID=1879320 RepID=UPI003B5ADCCC
MKLEMLGSASAGLFAVAGSWLAARGSAWEFMIIALLGAVVAILELDGWQPKKAGMIVVFNTIVGTFGGPLLLAMISFEAGPGGMLLISFLLGWAAHSIITDAREVVMDWFLRWMKRAGK